VPVAASARLPSLEVLPIAGLLAAAVDSVFSNESVSAIFAGESQLF